MLTITDWESDIYETKQFVTKENKYKAWKEVLANKVLVPLVKRNTYLEIGVGHGRWASYMVGWVHRSILIDNDKKNIEICQNRFGIHPHIEYITNNGYDLERVDDQSVDLVWSFDTMIALPEDIIYSYLNEIARVLKPGGHAAIHAVNLDNKTNLTLIEKKIEWGTHSMAGDSCIFILRNGEITTEKPPGPREGVILPMALSKSGKLHRDKRTRRISRLKRRLSENAPIIPKVL